MAYNGPWPNLKFNKVKMLLNWLLKFLKFPKIIQIYRHA